MFVRKSRKVREDMLAASGRSHFQARIYSKAHTINTLEKSTARSIRES
jgi:hypothetical protein